MVMDAIIMPLRQVALFQGLTPLQVTEIARHAERIVFRSGDTIIHAGEEGDAAYLIVSGDAVRTVAPGRPEAIERLDAGSLVGEMAMLIDTEHSATVVARGTVRALKLTRAAMHAHMLADPSIADHLVTKIAGRLKAVAAELRAIHDGLGPTAAVVPGSPADAADMGVDAGVHGDRPAEAAAGPTRH
jgi:CRP-like cAMP-binding protein